MAAQNPNNPASRLVITLSHAIVNEATTFLPGRKSLQPPSQITPIIQTPTASSTATPIQASSESTPEAAAPSQQPNSSSSFLVPTSTSSTESTTALSTSSEVLSTSASEVVESTVLLIESSSTILSSTSVPVVATSSSALAEASQALGQEKGQGEKAEKEAVATVPPPNNRGVAVGIAFGAFAGFSIAILAVVIIYKLRRKQRPKTGIKQFQ